MSKELNIPVKYNDTIIGWTSSENPTTIKFVDDESRKLIEEKIKQPISISSRSMGEIDENGKVNITKDIEYTIINEEQKKSEEIFILMKLGKMTLTEINTLTDNERFFLSKWFMESAKNEEQALKEGLKKLHRKTGEK